MGRWCTILGVLVSIGTAYLVMQFLSIMDYVQALFSFFIAPLFGTVLLGMLWKRATPAGRILGSAGGHGFVHRHVGLGEARSRRAALHRALAAREGHGGEHVSRACGRGSSAWSSPWWSAMVTKPKPDAELVGLVYGAPRFRRKAHLPLYQRPIFWAVRGRAWSSSILNIIFW